MRNKIFKNWGLKLGSILVAIILWFVAVQSDDPTISQTFTGIQVNITNAELLDAENKVFEVLDNTDTVRVTVRAPRSTLATLRASDIVAEADLSKLTDINTVAISYSTSKVATSAIEFRGDHDSVKLSIEDRISKWIRVAYEVTGETAEDYIVSAVSLGTTNIEISGPRSQVEQVSSAKVTVDVQGTTSNMSMNVEPVLYDSEGNALSLSNVTRNEDNIAVKVTVLATKTVPIQITASGTPGAGYEATGNILVSPSSVLIAGRTVDLADVDEIEIPSDVLDLTDLTETLVTTVNLTNYLPEGISLGDSSYSGRVTLTAYIEPIVSRTVTLDADYFTFTNVPEDFIAEAVIPEEGLEITISGLQDIIDQVEDSYFVSTIDIAEWMEEENITTLTGRTVTIPVSFETPDDTSLSTNTIQLEVIFTDVSGE